MFFLRPDYKYGDPTEQPEHLDEALCAELSAFFGSIPEEIGMGPSPLPEYQGRHTYLYYKAIAYALRRLTNGDPLRVTKEMFQAAAADQKNWPTRGHLMPHFGDEGFYEDRGPEDFRANMLGF